MKTIEIFYAAHISRSQAKSMFGNWTTCFGAKIRKISKNVSAENFQFLKLNNSLYIARASFVMQCAKYENTIIIFIH